MRFMVMVKGDPDPATGEVPPPELAEAMGRYNEQLAKAGVLLAANGLLHTGKGARVRFTGDGRTTVVDGPFAESKEVVAGFWLLQVRSKEEAIEWARRIPNPLNLEHEVEVRQVFDEDDPSGA